MATGDDGEAEVAAVIGDDGEHDVAGNGSQADRSSAAGATSTDRTEPLCGAPLVGTALSIAAAAHDGTTDKGGAPYLGHPLRVAARVVDAGEHAVAAALLHDVVEDSDTTLEDLRAGGMPEPVVVAVDALSRRDDESHEQAVRRAGADPIACVVKRADIADNLDPARTARLDAGVRERLATKYAHALAVLDAHDATP